MVECSKNLKCYDIDFRNFKAHQDLHTWSCSLCFSLSSPLFWIANEIIHKFKLQQVFSGPRICALCNPMPVPVQWAVGAISLHSHDNYEVLPFFRCVTSISHFPIIQVIFDRRPCFSTKKNYSNGFTQLYM